MKEIKRTYKFERVYLHGLNGQNATVTCEVEIDYDKKMWFIDNVTTHHLNGSGYSHNIPKIEATIEMHLEICEFIRNELGE